MRIPFPKMRGAVLAAAASAVIGVGALLVAPALADGPGSAGPDVAAPPVVRAAPLPTPEAEAPPTAEPAAAPEGRSGEISFDGGAFSLDVPAGYKFYDADEARAYLERFDAPTPNGAVLGLLAPADADIRSPATWATVVSYDGIGHVPTESASALESPEFPDEVRQARQVQNRVFEGFSAAPVFDPTSNNLAWGERVAAPGSGGRDLRYEQRILARNGVVGLTTLGAADQQGTIVAAAPALAEMVKVADAEAYDAFDPASDTISAYGLPDLVKGMAPSADSLISESGATSSGTPGGLGGLLPWIAGGVLVLAGIGYLMTRKRPDPNLVPSDEE